MNDQQKNIALGALVGGLIGGAVSTIARGSEASSGSLATAGSGRPLPRLPKSGHKVYYIVQEYGTDLPWAVEIDDGNSTLITGFRSRPSLDRVERAYERALSAGRGKYDVSKGY